MLAARVNKIISKFRNVRKQKVLNSSPIFKNLDKRARVYASTNAKGPLDGVKICDMTRILAGPYCTMLLGDMGAEVIKIERAGIGDETRTWGPPFVEGESCYFLSINRNKKSVCVDIHQKAGKEIIYEFVKNSDVFIENFVPGKLESLGFGYDKLSDINPSLIYCSISGYGSTGPDQMKPGYDLVASAIGGMLHITGSLEGAPCRPGVAVTDIITGTYAHSAIISALYERSFTNVGQKIDVSLLKSQVASLSHLASSYLNTDMEINKFGTAHPSIVPSRAFKTADGEIVITAANDKLFKQLCEVIGCNELLLDYRFKSNPDRVKNRNILEKVLGDCLQSKPTDDWLKLLRDTGVPCAPINNMKEVFNYPQVSASDVIQEIMHPVCGSIKIAAPPVIINGEETSILSSPPLLGEHTEELITKINIDDQTSSVN